MNATLEVTLTLACLVALVLTMMAGKIAEYVLNSKVRTIDWAMKAEQEERKKQQR